MIHLDTSFLIRALVPATAEDQKLRTWLRAGVPIATSAVAWAELLCGPLGERERALVSQIVGHVVPFDEGAAAEAAQLFNRSGRRRGSLADCMVAAVALRAGAALATSNRADFERFAAAGLGLAE